MRFIEVQEGFTEERLLQLNNLVSAAINALYDGGHPNFFSIHPAYESVVLPLLTPEEKAMLRKFEDILPTEDKE
jgi:hypothetical protein